MTTKKPGKSIRMSPSNDQVFMRACGIADVKATHRQWRKWVRGEGSAKAHETEARQPLNAKPLLDHGEVARLALEMGPGHLCPYGPETEAAKIWNEIQAGKTAS